MSDEISALLPSFRRSLSARNRADRTIQSYCEAASQLAYFLKDSGLPVGVADVRRQDVEAFVAYLVARFKPSTAAIRFRSLQQFFKWLVAEDEIERSPMEGMAAPAVPEQPVSRAGSGRGPSTTQGR